MVAAGKVHQNPKCLSSGANILEIFIKGAVMEIEKALINDRLRVSKVS